MPDYEAAFRAEAVCRNAPPGQLVEQAVRFKQVAEQLLFLAIVAARAHKMPWEEIGETLGVTKAAAHKRFADRVRQTGWGEDIDQTAQILARQWERASELVGQQEELTDLYCKMHELQGRQRTQG